MSTEQNPRDRLFDPNPDAADFRDREDGPEPVDETEDTIRDPAAHRPRVADPDQQTSDAIAEEAAAAPDDAADDRRVEDNNPGDVPAHGDRSGQEPVVRDSFDRPGDDDAARLSDSPDDVTAVSSPVSYDAIDRIDEPRGMDEGDWGDRGRGEDGLDRQTPRSATDLAEASDISGEQPSEGLPGGEDTPDAEDVGALLPGAETDRLKIRWREVQLGFVDDPRQAVDDAAEVVSLAVNQVASTLRDQVGALDADRSTGNANDGESDTERLRTLMRRYHALLDRMLAV